MVRLRVRNARLIATHRGYLDTIQVSRNVRKFKSRCAIGVCTPGRWLFIGDPLAGGAGLGGQVRARASGRLVTRLGGLPASVPGLATRQSPTACPSWRVSAPRCRGSGVRRSGALRTHDGAPGARHAPVPRCDDSGTIRDRAAHGTVRCSGRRGQAADAVRAITALSRAFMARVQRVREVRRQLSLQGGRAGRRIVCGTRRWRRGVVPPTR